MASRVGICSQRERTRGKKGPGGRDAHKPADAGTAIAVAITFSGRVAACDRGPEPHAKPPAGERRGAFFRGKTIAG